MITYNSECQSFKIDTNKSSYVFGIVDGKYLVHYYYGAHISDSNVGQLTAITKDSFPSNNKRDKLSFMDCEAFEFPTEGVGDFRPSAIEIEDSKGHTGLELSYVSHEIYKGKKTLSGLPQTFGSESDCETLEVTLKDSLVGCNVVLSFSVFDGIDAIVRSARVTNSGEEPFWVKRFFSLCLDADDRNYELLTLYGNWARERAIDRMPIRHGYQGVSSKRGITSHQEQPFLALVTPNTDQNLGEAYGFNFIYSGNFEAGVYVNHYDCKRVLMGINPYHFSWKLEKGESFQSPEAVMVFSKEGLGHMSRTFHDLYRKHLIRSPYRNKKRPILINNWEATYFDFNTEKLIDIAREAQKSGIEMLVMDDGWFGNRFDDNRSLGDWKVNEEKLPGGLGFLVSEVNKLGMKFGIWMEPEMVSPDSDLYRAHPDWAIQIPKREAGLARNQYVLDLTRPEVLEHTWNSINSVMDSANIEYVKWDMNRPLSDIGSLDMDKDSAGRFFHKYVMAVYELQNRLVSSYPELLLENCSSGGARFDPGMLYYSPQIWCSDDTDAIERLAIQEGTALVYPLSAIGAHVSDCPNHVLGRTVPFETRGHIALFGTFGYELDITKIPESDRNEIPKQVKLYHKYNDLVREGDYYRLASFSENHLYDSWMVVSKDQKEALVTFVNVHNRPNYKPFRLRLSGLLPDRKYLLLETGESFYGDVLMNGGLLVSRPWGDFKSQLFTLKIAD